MKELVLLLVATGSVGILTVSLPGADQCRELRDSEKSETCERISYELCRMRVAGRLHSRRHLRQILQKTETGVPRIVQRAINYRERAAKGGPEYRADGERAVRDARKLYADTLADKRRADALRGRYKKSGCDPHAGEK